MFTKLIKDGNAVINHYHQACRFVDGFETFESTAELLKTLADRRDFGMVRIKDALAFVDSATSLESLFIRMLRSVLTDEADRPLNRPNRNKVLFTMYQTNGLLQFLVDNGIIPALSTEAADLVCKFLLYTAKSFVEVRKSEEVIELARILHERSDVAMARLLFGFVQAQPDASPNWNPLPKTEIRKVLWGQDALPPGGRHDNDERNFRNIQILPTVNELMCEDPPYLPMENGENNVLDDAEQILLDRQFRLLREDAVKSMRLGIKDDSHAWQNARIVDWTSGDSNLPDPQCSSFSSIFLKGSP